MKKKIVALTGAGVSAESGIPTFRDSGGLWGKYDVTELASPEGWQKNPERVLQFYNERRKAALECTPNAAHRILSDLENYFDVVVVTQNVDNLHEKARSSNVIHLHGEIFKSRSTADESLIYDIEGWELKMGDECERGSQLRPYIVWFGEMVPMMDAAIQELSEADILLIIGTSLIVYPAAGLVDYAREDIPKFVVDPKLPDLSGKNLFLYREKASTGMKMVKDKLMDMFIR